MKLHVAHEFRGIDLTAYETLFFDEPFNIELCRATKLHRTLVRREVKDGRLLRTVRVVPERDIPAPVAKLIGAETLEYTEYVEYPLGSYIAQWRTEPAVLRDRIDSRGTYRFEATAGGVRRIVEGVVSVKVFGVGGIIERFVAGDVERSYDQAAAFTQAWIDRQRPGV